MNEENRVVCEVCDEHEATRTWKGTPICDDCWTTRPVSCPSCGEATMEGLLDHKGRCEICAFETHSASWGHDAELTEPDWGISKNAALAYAATQPGVLVEEAVW